jgi:hypothetical protein
MMISQIGDSHVMDSLFKNFDKFEAEYDYTINEMNIFNFG